MIKSSFFLSFLVIMAFGFFSSCSKSPDPAVSNNPQLSATIANASWTGTNVTSSDDGSIITIASPGPGGSSLGLGLSSYVKPGTYQVTETGQYTVQYTKNSSNLYQATSGQIVVTSYENKIIKGTFTAKAPNFTNSSDVITIANGTFTAKF